MDLGIYMVITSAEATKLWRLGESTLRQAIWNGRLPSQQSGKVHLVSLADVIARYGEPKPMVDEAAGSCFYLTSDNRWNLPLVDMGYVPDDPARRLLKTPDNFYVVISRELLVN